MQSQYWSLDLMPGLMLPERKSLEARGIKDTRELLAKTKTPEARAELASQLRLNQKHVSKWAALADLGRVPSVGNQYCGLLLHGSIASVAQLAQTPFHRLHGRISRLQIATSRRRDLVPPIELVKQWVEQAKMLERQS